MSHHRVNEALLVKWYAKTYDQNIRRVWLGFDNHRLLLIFSQLSFTFDRVVKRTKDINVQTVKYAYQ